jgi:hypothetical protein
LWRRRHEGYLGRLQAHIVFTPDHGLAIPWATCTLDDAGLGIAAVFRWLGASAAVTRYRGGSREFAISYP